MCDRHAVAHPVVRECGEVSQSALDIETDSLVGLAPGHRILVIKAGYVRYISDFDCSVVH